MGKISHKSKLLFLSFSISLMTLVAAPWYLRNLVNTGNPCWPLLLQFFSEQADYLYLMARNHTQYLTGNYSSTEVMASVTNFALNPNLPCSLWILAIIGFWMNRRTRFFIKTGMVLFIATWWLLQPRLLPRFSTYILPFACILIVLLYQTLCEKKYRIAQYLFTLTVGATILYSLCVGVLVSRDHFRYHLTGNLDEYHRTTRFYQEYKWLNHNLPKKSTLLVIVSAGQTYHSSHRYHRADPWSSGLIDWINVKTPAALIRQLHHLDINYIVYEQCDWSYCPGGKNMMQLMKDLQNDKSVNTVWERELKIYNSRLKKSYGKSKMILVEI